MNRTIYLHKAMEVPEGNGITVRRLMPAHGLRHFDPFVLWDHFDIASGGFPAHPHRGFEAITYMFEGGMQHADSLGNRGVVHGGGAQRFTAGSGIVHSEMPEGRAAGIQLWINLPGSLKGIDPDYQQVEREEIPEIPIDDGSVRTIVGEGSPISLHTETEYLDIRLNAGSNYARSIPVGLRGLIYVVEGVVSVDEASIDAGVAAMIGNAGMLTIDAIENSRFMWCFGRPHGEPILQHGPFVD